MAQTEKTSELTRGADVRLSRDTIKAVDLWAARNQVTRSEAVRRLLKSALRSSRAAAKLKLTSR